MGRTRRAPADTELVDANDRTAEMLAILRHYVERVKRGELTGIMVLAETPRGGWAHASVKMSGTDNVAERLGRLELIREAVLDQAQDEEIEHG